MNEVKKWPQPKGPENHHTPEVLIQMLNENELPRLIAAQSKLENVSDDKKAEAESLLAEVNAAIDTVNEVLGKDTAEQDELVNVGEQADEILQRFDTLMKEIAPTPKGKKETVDEFDPPAFIQLLKDLEAEGLAIGVTGPRENHPFPMVGIPDERHHEAGLKIQAILNEYLEEKNGKSEDELDALREKYKARLEALRAELATPKNEQFDDPAFRQLMKDVKAAGLAIGPLTSHKKGFGEEHPFPTKGIPAERHHELGLRIQAILNEYYDESKDKKGNELDPIRDKYKDRLEALRGEFVEAVPNKEYTPEEATQVLETLNTHHSNLAQTFEQKKLVTDIPQDLHSRIDAALQLARATSSSVESTVQTVNAGGVLSSIDKARLASAENLITSIQDLQAELEALENKKEYSYEDLRKIGSSLTDSEKKIEDILEWRLDANDPRRKEATTVLSKIKGAQGHIGSLMNVTQGGDPFKDTESQIPAIQRILEDAKAFIGKIEQEIKEEKEKGVFIERAPRLKEDIATMMSETSSYMEENRAHIDRAIKEKQLRSDFWDKQWAPLLAVGKTYENALDPEELQKRHPQSVAELASAIEQWKTKMDKIRSVVERAIVTYKLQEEKKKEEEKGKGKKEDKTEKKEEGGLTPEDWIQLYEKAKQKRGSFGFFGFRSIKDSRLPGGKLNMRGAEGMKNLQWLQEQKEKAVKSEQEAKIKDKMAELNKLKKEGKLTEEQYNAEAMKFIVGLKTEEQQKIDKAVEGFGPGRWQKIKNWLHKPNVVRGRLLFGLGIAGVGILGAMTGGFGLGAYALFGSTALAGYRIAGAYIGTEAALERYSKGIGHKGLVDKIYNDVGDGKATKRNEKSVYDGAADAAQDRATQEFKKGVKGYMEGISDSEVQEEVARLRMLQTEKGVSLRNAGRFGEKTAHIVDALFARDAEITAQRIVLEREKFTPEEHIGQEISNRMAKERDMRDRVIEKDVDIELRNKMLRKGTALLVAGVVVGGSWYLGHHYHSGGTGGDVIDGTKGIDTPDSDIIDGPKPPISPEPGPDTIPVPEKFPSHESGKNLWNILDKALEKRGIVTDQMDEGVRTHIVDSYRDMYAQMHPEELRHLGFPGDNPDIDMINPDSKIDVSILDKRDVLQNVLTETRGLSPEDLENIKHNNALLERYMSEHAHQLTSENVNETIERARDLYDHGTVTDAGNEVAQTASSGAENTQETIADTTGAKPSLEELRENIFSDPAKVDQLVKADVAHTLRESLDTSEVWNTFSHESAQQFLDTEFNPITEGNAVRLQEAVKMWSHDAGNLAPEQPKWWEIGKRPESLEDFIRRTREVAIRMKGAWGK